LCNLVINNEIEKIKKFCACKCLELDINNNLYFEVVILKIETITSNIYEFRIASDEQKSSINDIENRFKNDMKAILNNSQSIIKIDEYPERDYICVTHVDGSTIKYTGQKL
jgi:hypothetical protein